jgi:hypothetical protein
MDYLMQVSQDTKEQPVKETPKETADLSAQGHTDGGQPMTADQIPSVKPNFMTTRY